MRHILPAIALLLSSCTVRRAGLVAPQAGGADGSPPGWVDLRPGMELKIEGAYYREGSPGRNVADYLGDEVATYVVSTNGTLRLGSVSSFLDHESGKQQPRDQPAVQLLVRPRNLAYRYHRLVFQVLVSSNGTIRPAILLGSRSIAGIDKLTKQLLEGQLSGCGPGSGECAALPLWCTASPSIGIVVNGNARKVAWGSTLGSVAIRPSHMELLRADNGRSAAVQVDVADPEALRAPLAQGDQVSWN